MTEPTLMTGEVPEVCKLGRSICREARQGVKMSIKVKASVDQDEAIRRGHACGSAVVLDVKDSDIQSLTQDEREALVKSLEWCGGGIDKRVRFIIPEPTVNGIIEGLRSNAEKIAKEKAKEDAINAEANAVLGKFTTDRIADLYLEHEGRHYGVAAAMVGERDDVTSALSKILDNHPYRGLFSAKHDAKVKEHREGADAERKAREAAKDEARKHAIAERSAWINQHGSTRLKRMLKEDIECNAVYRDERLAADRPGWVRLQSLPGVTKDPRNPPEDSFSLLDEARKVDPESYLQWYVETHEHDEYCMYDTDECPEYDRKEYVAEAEYLDEYIVLFAK